MEPRDVVQEAIDGYHAHDVDRCLSIRTFTTTSPISSPYVIDEERLTSCSPGGPDVVRAVLVYRLDGALIHEILS